MEQNNFFVLYGKRNKTGIFLQKRRKEEAENVPEKEAFAKNEIEYEKKRKVKNDANGVSEETSKEREAEQTEKILDWSAAELLADPRNEAKSIGEGKKPKKKYRKKNIHPPKENQEFPKAEKKNV